MVKKGIILWKIRHREAKRRGERISISQTELMLGDLDPLGKKVTGDPRTRTPSEHSDAGISVVQEGFGFVKRNLSGAERGMDAASGDRGAGKGAQPCPRFSIRSPQEAATSPVWAINAWRALLRASRRPIIGCSGALFGMRRPPPEWNARACRTGCWLRQ
jgi:hypothetical protein